MSACHSSAHKGYTVYKSTAKFKKVAEKTVKAESRWKGMEKVSDLLLMRIHFQYYCHESGSLTAGRKAV